MSTFNNKLQICEVCSVNQAKYTCPKCEVRTCAMPCLNIHKKELKCDGLRDKTKFIPLNSFTDLDLLSDYRLLEGIGRSVEQLQNNPIKRYTRQSELPVHLYRLRGAAYNRGINLQFMPQHFSRHKQNTTFLNWKNNEFFWKVELIFLQAENVKWIVDRVPDTKRLSVLLEEIFSLSSSDPEDESLISLRVLQNKLKFYRACGITGLKALLKAENVNKSGSRFYELDFSLTLQENLKNKTIIEFPIIYITLKDHSDIYEIIDSDDEIESQMQSTASKSWKNRIDLKRKKFEVKKFKPSPKKMNVSINYFFNAEISDSDDESNINANHCKNINQDLHIPTYNELVKLK